jgi:serine/threonine protein kinase/WD40 repeat protein
MPSRIDCPPASQLQCFLDGLVSDEEAVPLERHLEQCAACLEALRKAVPADPIAVAMHGCATVKRRSIEIEVATQRILSRAGFLPLSGDTKTPSISAAVGRLGGGALPSDFLDPPQGAAELGRLGPYRVVAILGQGGMGVVYKAEDPELGRDVAIKVPRLDRGWLTSGSARQRFLREARAAAPIRHPHVCPIYSVGEHRGVPYVVMAFVEGQSLAERLSGGRMESCRQGVELIRQVAEGLSAVHAQGVIHRDLKPGNILFDQSGSAVLTDFGLAREEVDTQHLTEEGTLVGTIAYMAPEQALGERELDRRADIYALGVVLYQMLTGRLPFEGDPTRILSQVLHTAPPPPSRFRPGLDPALEAIVLKAMARQPEDRYGSAAAFAEALAACADANGSEVSSPLPRMGVAPGQPPSASQTLPSTVYYRPRHHRWRWVAASLLSLLGLGAVLLALLVPPQRPPQTQPRYGTLELTVLEEGTIYLDGAKQYVLAAPYDGHMELPPGEYRFTLKRGDAVVDTKTFKITSENLTPFQWPVPVPPETVEPLSAGALVRRPKRLEGVKSWTIDPVAPGWWSGAVAYCPTEKHGKYLAVSLDRSVGLWDLNKGAWAAKFFGGEQEAGTGGGQRLVWSPKGNALAVVYDAEKGPWVVWEVPSGRTLFHKKTGVECLTWSPDGNHLAIVVEKTVIKRWDVGPDGKPDEDSEKSFRVDGVVTAIAWGRNGRLAIGQETGLYLWDATSEKPTTSTLRLGKGLRFPQWRRSWDDRLLAWSPDGKFLAGALDDRAVHLWEADSWKELEPLKGAEQWIWAIAWSPDGNRIAAQTSQTWEKLLIWDAKDGSTPRLVEQLLGGRRGMSWSPNGERIAFGTGYGVWFFDLKKKTWDQLRNADGNLVKGKPEFTAFAWSRDGKTLAAGSRQVRPFLLTKMLSGNTRVAQPDQLDGIDGLAWSPNGDRVAGCWFGSAWIELFDSSSGSKVHSIPTPGGQRFFCLDWSKSGGLALGGIGLAVTDDGLQEVKPLPPKGTVRSIAWSPNGKVLAYRCNGTEQVDLWSIEGNQPLPSLGARGRPDAGMAWSVDGKLLGTGDGHLWKTGTWESVRPEGAAQGHPAATAASVRLACVLNNRVALINDSGEIVKELPERDYPICLSPDGKLLAAGGGRIWDTGMGQLLGTVLLLPDNRWLVMTAEGHFRGPKNIEQELQVVVRTKEGQKLLTLREFWNQYKWENDGSKVRLSPRSTP